ncbi:hypothetical protein C8Q76DRAFT_706433 [Earliella scabrosa]|nr:hypothetical protein C8Q76DRAFT_706433 [Earliella scabrosa]
MHRDVSAGNILIRVCVRKTDDRYSVYWEGILSDWELAKHTDSKLALQPQRTGTWHFMSAHLLYNPGIPSSIPDELESFLHVLIYGALRRMQSTLLTIVGFNNQYFAGCDLDGETNRITCPSAKRDSIVTRGVLVSGRKPVVFFSPTGDAAEDHPLNDLIARLMLLFHARYVVDEWEQRSRPTPATPVRRKKRLETIREVSEPMPDMGDIQDEDPESDDEEVRRPTALEEPTQQMYKDVKSLSRHAKVRKIFWNALYASEREWPEKDVVTDRTVADLMSLLPSAAQSVTPAAPKPAKRPRREPAQHPVAGPSSPPRRITRSRTAATVAASTAARPADPQPTARTADPKPKRAARPVVRRRSPPAVLPQDTGRRMTRSQSRALLAQGGGPTIAAVDGPAPQRNRASGSNTGRRLTRAATDSSTRSSGRKKVPGGTSAPASRGRARRG